MPSFPNTDETPLLRLDFSDDATWKKVCEMITAPVPFNEHMDFQANVSIVDDPAFAGVQPGDLAALVPEDTHSVLLVVDAETIANDEHPVLCIDLLDSPGQSFRFTPSVSWAVENNLSLGNADFEEVESLCDSDGVLRQVPMGPED